MQIKNLKIIPIVSIVLLIIMSFFCKPNSVEGASVVWTDKDIYNQGEVIRVNFTNAPGNQNDWICIVPAGSPDTEGGDYKYIPAGLRQGVLIFSPPSPGQYEVRAYYNYSRNGYVVSGRYAFSVVNDFVETAPPPPPIPFDVPPDVIVMPDTNDVYVVPDIVIDLFFWNGWWWRPWGGHWYRSQHYDRGWGYYNNVPSFYFDIDPGWRVYYRDRNWFGHRWDYKRIPHQQLQQNWKSWQNDRRWERQKTWDVRNYQPRPQKQRQELRNQRQQQYQHRQPQRQSEIQQRQKPQIQQPQRSQTEQQQRQPWGHSPQRQSEIQQRQKPQVQQPQRPQIEQQQRQPWGHSPQRQSELQQRQKPQVQQPQRPQIEQQQRQPWGHQKQRPSDIQQPQRPQVQQPQRPQIEQPRGMPQPQGKYGRGAVEGEKHYGK